MGILEGRKIIITGASRGIGLAAAEACLREGAVVAASYRRSEDGLADLISSPLYSERIKALQLDVTDKSSVDKFYQEVLKDFGGIDILINNAGIAEPALFAIMSDDQWNGVIQTNLYGCYYMLKKAVFPMISQKRGAIVNVASVNGLTGNIGQSSYCASKAAIIGLTRSLSRELAGKNIRVNAVAPGYIDTDMTGGLTEAQRTQYTNQIPMKRFGRAAEIAEVIVFLACERSSYITGQVIVADGGLL